MTHTEKSIMHGRSKKTVSFNVSAEKLHSEPCLVALNTGGKCGLIVYNSNRNGNEICTVEGSNLCQSEPPLLALNTPIMLSEKDNNIDVIGITLPKKLYNSLQPFDFEVGRTHGSYSVLPPQNIDWVVAPISKTELSTILKYRPPATNAALLKNFTFIILEEGAEKERIIVNVSDEVFRQMDDKVSVTNDQVLQSQTDETVFLNVTLKSRLSQGKNLELKVFTNGDEVRSDIFTLKPPIFDPMQFWETSIKSVKSTAISFGWRTPIFGAEDFLRVILKARSIGGESEERHIPASNYRGELEGLQPWTNYSITITAVYTHGSYEKKMGMYRTGVDAPPAPDVVNATVTGPAIINASWSPVTTFRGKKLYYQAVCEDADWKFYDRYGGLDTTSTIFKRLSDCTEYKCKVTAVAVGDRGQEAKSEPVFSNTVRTWPPSPHQIRVQFARQFSTEGVTVSWVQALVRCSLLEYTIQVKPVQQPQSIVLVMKYPSNVTKALISGLEDNAHYEVRVRYDILPDRDGHGGGVGEFSEPKQFWTWPQAPSQPTDVAARAINSTAIRVSWNQPDRLGGIISAYTIYVNFPLLNGTVVSRNLTLAVKENDSSLFLVVDELPSETIIRVAIRATTNASSRGEGGGQGKASVIASVVTASGFSVSAGGDIGWPNSNRLVLSLYYYPNEEGARVYIKWPVESPDRLVSLEVVADPEKTVCPAVSRVNRTVTERPEMTLHGLEKNCVYEVTVTVRTRFNELGLSEVSNISTNFSYHDIAFTWWRENNVSFNVPAEKLHSEPCLVALNSGGKCQLVVYNSNRNGSELCTVEGSNLCPSEPPLLALTTPILLSEKNNMTRAISILLPKRLHDSLQPFDLKVGQNRRSYHVLPPQNIDWVVAPISKTELSTILKYRPPPTNPALLKNFTFVILKKGAEKERIIVNVNENVSRQMDDHISVTTDQVLQSQSDETVFLNVSLKTRLSQGEDVELRVFTNRDEVTRAVYTLKPPIFDPIRFWEAAILSVKSRRISFRWTTPIFGNQHFLFVLLEAEPIGGEKQGLFISATETSGALEGLQPWTYYNITITAIYTHGWYEKKIGMCQTAIEAPPAPDFVKATVAGPGIISLSWSPITAFGGKELYYKAACRDANWKLLEPPVRLNTTSIIFKRLNDCTQYKCKVTAMAVGDRTQEAESEPIFSNTVRTWPPRPLKVKLELVQQLRPEGVSVSWQEATITCGAIEYTIHIKPVRQHQAIGLEMKYPSNVTKALISGLEDNAHYEVRVRYDILPDRDGHGGGVGEFSEPKQFWTWPQAPSKPTDVTARVINNSAIRVSWNPPDRAGGIISVYTVYTSFLLRNGTAESRNLTGFSMKNKGGISLVVGDLPSRTLVKVTIRATTKSSFRGEGGGPGDVSRAVFVLTAADPFEPSKINTISTTPVAMKPAAAHFLTPDLSEPPNGSGSPPSPTTSMKPVTAAPPTAKFLNPGGLSNGGIIGIALVPIVLTAAALFAYYTFTKRRQKTNSLVRNMVQEIVEDRSTKEESLPPVV
uniref:Protogenin n=1 Tax=Schistocephalus solidus TaxID=70667 RepID=A0A0V0JA85_SCHSO